MLNDGGTRAKRLSCPAGNFRWKRQWSGERNGPGREGREPARLQP
jgi:hypothetical protein